MSYGMLHGMFKAYDGKTNSWMISTAHRSQLESNVGCWIVSPDYVSQNRFKMIMISKYKITD